MGDIEDFSTAVLHPPLIIHNALVDSIHNYSECSAKRGNLTCVFRTRSLSGAQDSKHRTTLPIIAETATSFHLQLTDERQVLVKGCYGADTFGLTEDEVERQTPLA